MATCTQGHTYPDGGECEVKPFSLRDKMETVIICKWLMGREQIPDIGPDLTEAVILAKQGNPYVLGAILECNFQGLAWDQALSDRLIDYDAAEGRALDAAEVVLTMIGWSS